MYSAARLGSSCSVLDFLHMATTLSTRSFVRVGSTFSINGRANLAQAPRANAVGGPKYCDYGYSVVSHVQLGSALSVRTGIRLEWYIK